MFNNPFTPVKPPEQRFLEAIAAGYTDTAAAGSAGWTVAESKKFAEANEREYEIATNKRQYAYEEYLMATGRGTDIARVALRQETRSWVQKAEVVPAKSVEDYVLG